MESCWECLVSGAGLGETAVRAPNCEASKNWCFGEEKVKTTTNLALKKEAAIAVRHLSSYMVAELGFSRRYFFINYLCSATLHLNCTVGTQIMSFQKTPLGFAAVLEVYVNDNLG